MNPSQLGILLAAAAALLLPVRAAIQGRKERKQRDFTRTLETALQPRETVKVICPQKKGRWVLTSKRLLIEEKGGFRAISLEKIQSVQGKNAAGNRTTVPEKMTSLLIRGDKEFVAENTGEQFLELVKQLQAKRKTQKKK